MSGEIVIAQPRHITPIVTFQLKMAQQTQNLKLDSELVEKAVAYFISLNQKQQPSQFGFYLVKEVSGQAVGSLMLTFQSQSKWWIQSVYVDQTHRRNGHFRSLFQRSVSLAKEKGVQSIKLYAENSNQRAKQTYFKLGMHIIQGNFYSYDFVYGASTIPTSTLSYKLHFNNQNNSEILDWIKDRKNILLNKPSKTHIDKDMIVVKREGMIVGAAKYFQEFSDWRFGLTRYISQLYLENEDDLESIIPQIIAFLVQTSSIKVAVVRFIINQAILFRFIGGHMEHYDILEITLK